MKIEEKKNNILIWQTSCNALIHLLDWSSLWEWTKKNKTKLNKSNHMTIDCIWRMIWNFREFEFFFFFLLSTDSINKNHPRAQGMLFSHSSLVVIRLAWIQKVFFLSSYYICLFGDWCIVFFFLLLQFLLVSRSHFYIFYIYSAWRKTKYSKFTCYPVLFFTDCIHFFSRVIYNLRSAIFQVHTHTHIYTFIPWIIWIQTRTNTTHTLHDAKCICLIVIIIFLLLFVTKSFVLFELCERASSSYLSFLHTIFLSSIILPPLYRFPWLYDIQPLTKMTEENKHYKTKKEINKLASSERSEQKKKWKSSNRKRSNDMR